MQALQYGFVTPITLGPNAGLLMDTWLAPYPEATGLILLGPPAEEIMGTADKDRLIVLGQDGHSALKHLLFGATASKVVRHAPCDVLVARGAKD